ncbi:hypothetical protein RHSP_83553 [Rhizobium freirei PRF 81]|uniref:Uncharacterized protein n=1 Tax=Rhizobium freirei PRF 81 TaxID=363754 RepID=N6VBW8_9HYPH|nr:hypothetical protein RHSP_83553 [Rhizobium freirei PRF 81]
MSQCTAALISAVSRSVVSFAEGTTEQEHSKAAADNAAVQRTMARNGFPLKTKTYDFSFMHKLNSIHKHCQLTIKYFILSSKRKNLAQSFEFKRIVNRLCYCFPPSLLLSQRRLLELLPNGWFSGTRAVRAESARSRFLHAARPHIPSTKGSIRRCTKIDDRSSRPAFGEGHQNVHFLFQGDGADHLLGMLTIHAYVVEFADLRSCRFPCPLERRLQARQLLLDCEIAPHDGDQTQVVLCGIHISVFQCAWNREESDFRDAVTHPGRAS